MSENKDIETFEESEIYSLIDENGEESEFELIAECELNGNKYFAMSPLEDEDVDEKETFEYVILKVVTEDGEEVLVSIDDDDEFDEVADHFDDLLSSEIDYDA